MKDFNNVWENLPQLSESQKRAFQGRRAVVGNFLKYFNNAEIIEECVLDAPKEVSFQPQLQKISFQW